MRINRTKLTALILFVLMLVVPAIGPVAGQDPVTITVFRGGVTLDYNNDPVIQEIEKRLNINIEFMTAAWSEIGQVRNLALGSGEDVDIYHHMDTSPQWIEDEVIIPLDEYIDPEKHPYLTAITSSPMFEAMKYEGKTYYIPMIAHGSDWVWAIRKDWMDELGLEMPANEEEFRAILEAFKGMDDSGRMVGWQVEGGGQVRRSILPLLGTFGVPTSFYSVHKTFSIDEEGMIHPIATADNTKAALKYLNGLYNEGLINTDFPSMTSFPMLMENYLQAGKAGVGWVQNPTNTEVAGEKVEWAYIPPFNSEGFEQTRAVGIINNGWIAISSESDNPQKAIDLLEFVNSYEGRQLLVAGVPGVHFNEIDEDGNFDRIQEAWDANYDGSSYPLYFYFGQGLMHGYIPVEKYDTFEEALMNVEIWEPKPQGNGLREVIKQGGQWAGAPDPFQFIQFPELDDIRAEVSDAIVTGWTKVITAAPEEFDAEWDAFVAEWERAGGEEWTAAFQTYYDENMK